MKRELERVDVPGEHEARERAWNVVTAAFSERTPVPQTSHWPRVAAVAIALSTVVAATVSSPGRAVLDEIREVVGVERAQPALFSLPAPGRLLVASDAGVWVVSEDGSRRLLGDYREATWSPFGRYVAATRENELVAIEPDGDVRWTLARRGARSPRWTGSEADTRIAYLTTTRVHAVPGDGTGDVDVGGPSHRVAPVWRPSARFTLTYVDTLGRVRLYDIDSGLGPWRPAGLSKAFRGPRKLEWSSDGRRLLFLTRRKLVLFGSRSRSPLSIRSERLVDAALRPGSHELAVLRTREGVSELLVGKRSLFSGTGRFTALVWSPDGRWLLLGWPAADQWVFVRADGKRIRAVSNVSAQFHSQSFPRVEGWCCAP
ncbi:MAG: PD40 domain-containing protein [Actinobacteria bacterium]|nr:PD40 domain-containing protein [Actinomycetota bacterium]